MMTFRTLMHGGASPADSFSVQPGLLLVRTADEFQRRWELMTKGDTPALEIPVVDFAAEAVVMLALGMRPTTGYSVTIDRVEAGADVLEVSATETRPSGYTGDLVTEPVHLVAVPAVAARDDLRLILRITND